MTGCLEFFSISDSPHAVVVASAAAAGGLVRESATPEHRIPAAAAAVAPNRQHKNRISIDVLAADKQLRMEIARQCFAFNESVYK